MNFAQVKQRIFKAFLTISLGAIFAIGSTAGTLPASILSPIGGKDVVVAKEHRYEVFGFAPYWTINKLDNVDFNTLTTLAYFGVPVNSDGTFDKDNIGYTTLEGERAQDLFRRAHSHGTRVVLTLTQMKNDIILNFLDDEKAQDRAIDNAIRLVKK